MPNDAVIGVCHLQVSFGFKMLGYTIKFPGDPTMMDPHPTLVNPPSHPTLRPPLQI